jgi:hypothetical protein
MCHAGREYLFPLLPPPLLFALRRGEAISQRESEITGALNEPCHLERTMAVGMTSPSGLNMVKRRCVDWCAARPMDEEVGHNNGR